MSTKPILKVYPNPFSARDVTGAPCGVVPLESNGQNLGYVGATVDTEATEVVRKEQKARFLGKKTNKPLDVVTVPGRQVTRWKFLGIPAAELAKNQQILLQQSPVRVQFSAYYLRRIQHGELILADEESARHCAFHVGALPKLKDPKEAKTPAEAVQLRRAIERQQALHVYVPPSAALAKASGSVAINSDEGGSPEPSAPVVIKSARAGKPAKAEKDEG